MHKLLILFTSLILLISLSSIAAERCDEICKRGLTIKIQSVFESDLNPIFSAPVRLGENGENISIYSLNDGNNEYVGFVEVERYPDKLRSEYVNLRELEDDNFVDSKLLTHFDITSVVENFKVAVDSFDFNEDILRIFSYERDGERKFGIQNITKDETIKDLILQ